MKKIIQYIVLFTISLVIWKCQLFKEPFAAIMSKTLPSPIINSSNTENFPLADFNLNVKDLEGNIIKMSDYKGKVIFLNFWATWCMPCVAELPSINNLYKELKDENIAFLLISNEQLEKVKDYHSKKDYQVPFHTIDNEGNIPHTFSTQSIPTTFIINKEGKIIRKSMGAKDWNDPQFIKDIRKLL